MSAIKTGDMVMLVWACCAHSRQFMGWTGLVEDVKPITSLCFVCGTEVGGVHARVTVEHRGFIPLPWLIKVEPPGEQQTQENHEEVTA